MDDVRLVLVTDDGEVDGALESSAVAIGEADSVTIVFPSIRVLVTCSVLSSVMPVVPDRRLDADKSGELLGDRHPLVLSRQLGDVSDVLRVYTLSQLSSLLVTACRTLMRANASFLNLGQTHTAVLALSVLWRSLRSPKWTPSPIATPAKAAKQRLNHSRFRFHTRVSLRDGPRLPPAGGCPRSLCRPGS